LKQVQVNVDIMINDK